MTLRVLITGCNGLLGTAITQRLNDMGCTTIGVTKDQQTTSLCHKTVYGSATNEELVSSVMIDIDVVVHLAAIRSPRNNPAREIFEENSLSTFNVLSLAAERGVQTIIHVSSISTLGFSFSQTPLQPTYLPIDDGYPCRVSDAYGLSKLVDEQTVRYINQRYDSNIYAIRFPYVGDAEVLLPERAKKIAFDSNFAVNDFWSYLDIIDAVAVVETLMIEKPVLSDPIFTVVAPNTLAGIHTEDLIQRHFPGLQQRPRFERFESLFAPSILLEKSSFRFRRLYANS
jgi:nucleoside-diphosphate-sugar epimerase